MSQKKTYASKLNEKMQLNQKQLHQKKQATEQQTSARSAGPCISFCSCLWRALGKPIHRAVCASAKSPYRICLRSIRNRIWQATSFSTGVYVCFETCFCWDITAHVDVDGFWLRSRDPSSAARVQWSLTRKAGWYLQSTHASTFQVDNSVFDVGVIPSFLQNVLDISVDAEEWSRIGFDLGMGKLITSITVLKIYCVWAFGFGNVICFNRL